MAGPAYHCGAYKEEDGCPRGRKREEAGPRDRPRYDDRQYLTEEQVRSVRYQKPHSTHLLNKYERQYNRRRRHDRDDEGYEHLARGSQRKRKAWINIGIVPSSSIAG